ncbi:hypothetical protein [Paenibacillus apiarius]|uniref:DUF4306 domain-containing protein n=1 Tax=Paenibacillus apiarius TaxID=46240 RepID=A0ABT4E0U4_9BACL|nr:hypothetical protein [Paenibacillus apiarius]MCY9517899.1 hypothetical protein [Paenibacillus apiarius]MCY9523100.1 hypothetical protein [Paenibacillus apiarius]MCY9553946.1 hypothetical protein [Paenibacillus apiarius]MCY9559914.1 hypothetical protein [Paenibacillus apiarius]MCY9686385.1 hypothetical protein [Paenibacillus apiarius]
MKKVFLAIYLVVVTFIGVVYVPVTVVWGQERKFVSEKYVPLWELQEAEHTIDNYLPVFELNYLRLVYELLIATLIVYTLYLIFKTEKS